jgi:hypothetical protein
MPLAALPSPQMHDAMLHQGVQQVEVAFALRLRTASRRPVCGERHSSDLLEAGNHDET